MRLIPGKTKVQIELFKGVSLWDVLIGGIAAAMLILVVVSSLPFKFVIAIVIFMIAAMLLLRLDTEPNYIMILNMLKHLGYNRYYERMYDDETLLNIENGNIKEKVLDEFEKEAQKRQEAEAKEDKKAEKKKKKEKIFGEIKNTESSDTPEKTGEPEMSLKEIIKLENEILKSKTSTEEEKNAVWLARAKRSAEKKEAKKNAKRESLKNKADNKTAAFMDNIIAFTGIKDDFIEYNGKYYGAVIEIDPVEFRFFSPHRRNNSIEMGVGRVLRSVHSGFAANIVKIERPIIYDSYLAKEEEKLNEIRKSYESGMMSEDELKARVDIENDRIAELKGLCSDKQVLAPFYYIVLFESDKKQLELQVRNALDSLQKGELSVRRLNTKELAVFLKYTYGLDFNERDIEKYKPEDYAKWAM
ncbi:MAG: hypothetical protein IKS09_04080, partial [Lachnospiraceae bacterium]|nr:hypothetical protein [Lachnospiraceae bacterium]